MALTPGQLIEILDPVEMEWKRGFFAGFVQPEKSHPITHTVVFMRDNGTESPRCHFPSIVSVDRIVEGWKESSVKTYDDGEGNFKL